MSLKCDKEWSDFNTAKSFYKNCGFNTTPNFDIKILDQLISYTNNKTNETNVFSFKMNFIEPNKTNNLLPTFHCIYKSVNKNRMPLLINSNYNFTYNLDFEIYKIKNEIIYIIESNPITNIRKKYLLVTDLNVLNNYFIKN